MNNERVCHMSKVKGVQVSTTISPELNAAIENHRWDARKTKAEVVKTAIEQYATSQGLNWAAPPSVDESNPDEGNTDVA